MRKLTLKKSFNQSFWTILCLVSILFTACGKKQEETQSLSLEQQSLGAAANSILADAPYSKMILEIAYATGQTPDPNAVDFLVKLIDAHAGKPGGIVVEQYEIPSQTQFSTTTAEQIQSIENQYRKHHTEGDTLSVFILYSDTTSAKDTSDEKEFGAAYAATSIVVYKKTISTFVDNFSKARVEKTVLGHEIGHLMGLVNSVRNGEDLSQSKHCKNPNCLMYYRVYSGPSSSQSVPDFDDDCINELKSRGGK